MNKGEQITVIGILEEFPGRVIMVQPRRALIEIDGKLIGFTRRLNSNKWNHPTLRIKDVSRS